MRIEFKAGPADGHVMNVVQLVEVYRVDTYLDFNAPFLQVADFNKPHYRYDLVTDKYGKPFKNKKNLFEYKFVRRVN